METPVKKFTWEKFDSKEFFRDTNRVAKVFREAKESNSN